VNRLAPAIILLIIIFSALVLLPETGTVMAYEGIYIRADGSVEGTDEIQRVGAVYTFTDNVEGSIFVEKNAIVIDGAGYKLQPSGDSVGIDLRERNNVTVKNLRIEGFLGRCGILLIDTLNCDIIRNNLTDNFVGIEMTGSSSRNRITENRVQNNQVGMEIYSDNPGSDNVISENEVSNNDFGINIKDFINTNLSGNKITSNTCGIGLGAGSGSIARNNIMNNNNFIGNTKQWDDIGFTPWPIPLQISISIWDDDKEGNYWSDYEDRYPNATELDGSGVWNTPYVLDEDNRDNYPLMNPMAFPEKTVFQHRTIISLQI